MDLKLYRDYIKLEAETAQDSAWLNRWVERLGDSRIEYLDNHIQIDVGWAEEGGNEVVETDVTVTEFVKGLLAANDVINLYIKSLGIFTGDWVQETLERDYKRVQLNLMKVRNEL